MIRRRLLLRTAAVLAAILALGGALGCGEKRPSADGRLSIFVSILPQRWFVERIVGDLATVHVLVEPGEAPTTYQTTPRQMAELAEADLYFHLELPFEKELVPRIRRQNPDLKMVDNARGIQKRVMESHAHAGAASPGEDLDPHVWLSPPLMKRMCKTIAEEVSRIDRPNASVYRENLDGLLADIEKTHREIESLLAPYRGREVFVFHPAFGYFLDAYGLKQRPIELEGKEPKPKQLSEMVREARAAGARTIFVQPQYDPKSARAVARALGGRVEPLDPLPERPLENALEMARKIRAAVDEKPAQ